jgi:signal transduction histidine kinase
MMRTLATRSTILRLLGREPKPEEPEPARTEEEGPPTPTPAHERGAFEELRVGFTAAVSHELRTPLARLLVLLDTALLPNSDAHALVVRAREEVEQMRELIDDVLFLSELETGDEIVGLGATPALPVLREVAGTLEEAAARAGVTLAVEGDADAAVPLRRRMIRVIAENLAENAIRYAGLGARAALSVRREEGGIVLAVADDGVGIAEEELPRLFERFYRSDRARASRGTGLGLAIVKHVVTSAGGTVDAEGARGEGLTIRCVFPAR